MRLKRSSTVYSTLEIRIMYIYYITQIVRYINLCSHLKQIIFTYLVTIIAKQTCIKNSSLFFGKFHQSHFIMGFPRKYFIFVTWSHAKQKNVCFLSSERPLSYPHRPTYFDRAKKVIICKMFVIFLL